MPLIPYDDIRGLLPTGELSDTQLDSAMKLVASDLRDAIKPAQLPAELTEAHPLYGAAFRLVVMDVTNPEGVQSRGFGPKTRTYDTHSRRQAILDDLRESYRQAVASPVGCFPPVQDYPDPAARPRPRW